MTKWTHSVKTAGLAAVAAMALLGSGPSAEAASCTAMMNELRQLDRASANAARYQRALAQQSAALRKVERALQQNDCMRRSSNVCRQYAGAQRKMLSNVRALQRKAGGGGSARKAALHRALDRNCSSRSASNDRRRPGLLASLFSGSNRSERRAEAQRARIESTNVSVQRSTGRREQGSGIGGGSYRALCVRLGDGYYWPAGRSASRGEFLRVEAECVASCPGQEVKLYVHPFGTETDQMVSARDGSPYTRIPAAHAYRSAYSNEHQCGKGTDTKIIASPPALPRSLRLARMEANGTMPLSISPMPRPTFDENGNLVLTVSTTPEQDETPLVAERPIRVVGPKFLSDRLAGSSVSDPARQDVPSMPSEGA